MFTDAKKHIIDVIRLIHYRLCPVYENLLISINFIFRISRQRIVAGQFRGHVRTIIRRNYTIIRQKRGKRQTRFFCHERLPNVGTLIRPNGRSAAKLRYSLEICDFNLSHLEISVSKSQTKHWICFEIQLYHVNRGHFAGQIESFDSRGWSECSG